MSDEDIEDSLIGKWYEVHPEIDRTILEFSSGNRLTRTDGDGNFQEYSYRIDGNSIFLSIEGQEGSSELYFNKTEPGRFMIENLYVSTPERDPVYMIFEKQ
jgi:hypothetical protein